MNVPLDRPARILVIDDDPLTHSLIAAILRSSRTEVHTAEDGEAGIALAREVLPDLILLDYDMPDMNGLQVKERLAQDDVLYTIPVVFATGADNNKVLSACFAAGADDYVRKPLCAPELRARLGSVLQRRVLSEQMNQLENQDLLTGLLNRRGIQARIEDALQSISPSRRSAVLFGDLDGFRQVNGTLGQEAGDMLLGDVGGRLRDRLEQHVDPRVRWSTGRLGCDGFAVVLENLDAGEAESVANDLVSSFRQPFVVKDHEVAVTLSVGVAPLRAGDTLGDVFRDAEAALQVAKRAGGNRSSSGEPALTG